MSRWTHSLKRGIRNKLKSKGFVFRDEFEPQYHEVLERLNELELLNKRIGKPLLDKAKMQFKTERIAVYTVITGNYDDLENPSYIDECCDYYCITNNKELCSDFYRMIYVEDKEQLGNVKLQRYIKIHPWEFFPEYNYSVYIDGKMNITKSLLDYIGFFSDGASLLAFMHFERDCLYDEGEICKHLNKDVADNIDAQLTRYREEGFPSHYGLIDSAVLFRRHHDDELKKHHQAWWQELKSGSKRDQLSFNYVCWKTSFKYDVCPLHIYQNSFFKAKAHK